MSQNHVLIFEPVAHGDEMDYIRHLLNTMQAHLSDSRATLLTSQEASQHPNCIRLIADFTPFLALRVMPAVQRGNALLRRISPYYEYQWKNAESLQRGMDELDLDDIDFVFFPHLETIGLLEPCFRRRLFHRKSWATIAHNIRFHHRASGIAGPFLISDVFQRVFFHWLLRDPTLVCMGTNNPYLPSAVSHPKVVYCPPPAVAPVLSGMSEAREFYGIRPETCVILVFGVIDRRKCVKELLEGAARVVPELDLTVFVAGKQSPGDMADAMAGEAARKLRTHGRLIEVNRFINYDSDIDPISASDIIWVLYDRNYVRNSDVLARAALAERPVIARRQGLIGRLVDDNQLGLAVATDAPEAIAEALTRLVLDPPLRGKLGQNGARAFASNTPERLMLPIVDAMTRTFEKAPGK
jgi:glycosyltransferase involved in cell wall biosynthesis